MTTKVSPQEYVQQQVEIWNSHDVKAVGASYAENAVVHDPAYAEPLSGRAAIEKDASDFFTAFPDLRFEATNIVSSGDTIAIEGKASGTHTGPLNLPTGLVPATNKRVEFTIGIFTVLDSMGLAREERRYYDVAGQLQQLGLMQ
jgi:steroid delta-isomerase-like uncharacterized protein